MDEKTRKGIAIGVTIFICGITAIQVISEITKKDMRADKIIED